MGEEGGRGWHRQRDIEGTRMRNSVSMWVERINVSRLSEAEEDGLGK